MTRAQLASIAGGVGIVMLAAQGSAVTPGFVASGVVDLLINGDTVVEAGGTYDFGDVSTATPDNRTVVLRNNSGAPVDVFDVTLIENSGPVGGVTTSGVFSPRPQTVNDGDTLELCTLAAFSFSTGEWLGEFSPDADGGGTPLFTINVRCNFV